MVSFSINLQSGALVRLSSSKASITEGNISGKPSYISVGPKGRYAYVANQLTDNITGVFKASISVLAIDQNTGVLNFISSFFPPLNNWSIGHHPEGKFVYIPSYNDNTISTFALNDATNEFSKVGLSKAGGGPSSIVVAPNGQLAYGANFKNNSVSVLSIDALSGALNFQSSASTRTTESAGKNPLYIEIHSSGKFVYTANYGSGSISVFSVNTNSGNLKAVSSVNSTNLPATVISSLSIEPTGQYLYSMTLDSGIWVFSIDPENGSLNEVARNVGRSDLRIVFTKATP